MSRSKRKTPIMRGGGSDKWWRRNYNRKLRRANKVRLQKQEENFIPVLVKEVSNVWDSNIDSTYHFWEYEHGIVEVWYPSFWGMIEGISREEYIEKERKEAKEEYKKWMRK